MGCAKRLRRRYNGRCRRLPYGQDDVAMEVTAAQLCAAHLRSREKLVEKYDVSSTGTGGGGGDIHFRTLAGPTA